MDLPASGVFCDQDVVGTCYDQYCCTVCVAHILYYDLCFSCFEGSLLSTSFIQLIEACSVVVAKREEFHGSQVFSQL